MRTVCRDAATSASRGAIHASVSAGTANAILHHHRDSARTGNRFVANAAIEACKLYAPAVYPRRDPPPMPLGGSPPPNGDDR